MATINSSFPYMFLPSRSRDNFTSSGTGLLTSFDQYAEVDMTLCQSKPRVEASTFLLSGEASHRAIKNLSLDFRVTRDHSSLMTVSWRERGHLKEVKDPKPESKAFSLLPILPSAGCSWVMPADFRKQRSCPATLLRFLTHRNMKNNKSLFCAVC